MRIFFLVPRVPYPTEKGDKLRAFHQIKNLSRHHEIILCALNDSTLHKDALPVLSRYVKAVHVINLDKLNILINIIKALFTGRPMSVGYFYSPSAKRQILKLVGRYNPDHIFCQLIRVAPYVKDLPVPKTIDYQDVFSKGMDRRKALAPFYLKPFLKIEHRRLQNYENMVFDCFDNKIIISEPDRDLIPHPQRNKITVVANGVDTDFFTPLDREKKYDLVFTGNMGYPPNINSAEYLVNQILPKLLHLRPDIRILLAGANPHIRVLVLQSGYVDVSGWIPDMRECYASAKIFIAPMQIGTGLQNKLLEAMAMEVPCITSPLAFQALNARSGEDILVAESSEEFVRHIICLLDNPEKARQIGRNGHEFVHRNFTWEKETEKIEKLINSEER